MIGYGANELASSFRTVRKNTLILAEEISDEHYVFRATSEVRSVCEMLSHLAVSTIGWYDIHAVKQLTTFDGLDFSAFMKKQREESDRLRTKSQILDTLKKEGNKWADWLATLSDDFLSQQIGMPSQSTPSSKSRFELLLSAKEHEMHHRAQLMLIQRLLGKVPHLTRQREAVRQDNN